MDARHLAYISSTFADDKTLVRIMYSIRLQSVGSNDVLSRCRVTWMPLMIQQRGGTYTLCPLEPDKVPSENYYGVLLLGENLFIPIKTPTEVKELYDSAKRYVKIYAKL